MTEPCEGCIRRHLIIAAVVSSLGGFLFGYDNIVISGAIGYLAKAFNLDMAGVGWAAGCAGGLFDRVRRGRMAGGPDRPEKKPHDLCRLLCRIIGRRDVLLFPEPICGLANSGRHWHRRRFDSGADVHRRNRPRPDAGAAGDVVPVGHRAGDSHRRLRQHDDPAERDGAMESGPRLEVDVLRGAVPAMLFGLMVFPSQESPRWLLKMGRNEEGLAVLTRINGQTIARQECDSIRESLRREEGRFSELFTSGFGRALFLGIVLAGLTQTSGITPVFSYLPSIFEAAGTRTGDAFFQSVLVSLINLVFTLLALWMVDKLGRRTLLLMGTTTQALAFGLVGLLYLLGNWPMGILIGVMTFVAAHAVGNGVVCWVIISEIFPTKVRGRAMSMATTSLWIFAFLGNLVFPAMQKGLGNHGAFWVFGFMAFVNVLFVSFLVPETKGYSLEEIERLFAKDQCKELVPR